MAQRTLKKLVFFTGAGMSAESGLPTFRGAGGLWDSIDAEAVADRKSWYSGRRPDCRERRQAMLDFFNPVRRMIINGSPNSGHKAVAAFERDYDVTVITQNGDDYHERAGSSDVIHLHGEALKNASTLHPYKPLEIDMHNPDIHIGDRAEDGSQIRPYVIFFNEDIDAGLWRRAVQATRRADILVVIGSTMLVYPAAGLLGELRAGCPVYVIDPADVRLPDDLDIDFFHLRLPATEGLAELKKIL